MCLQPPPDVGFGGEVLHQKGISFHPQGLMEELNLSVVHVHVIRTTPVLLSQWTVLILVTYAHVVVILVHVVVRGLFLQLIRE